MDRPFINYLVFVFRIRNAIRAACHDELVQVIVLPVHDDLNRAVKASQCEVNGRGALPKARSTRPLCGQDSAGLEVTESEASVRRDVLRSNSAEHAKHLSDRSPRADARRSDARNAASSASFDVSSTPAVCRDRRHSLRCWTQKYGGDRENESPRFLRVDLACQDRALGATVSYGPAAGAHRSVGKPRNRGRGGRHGSRTGLALCRRIFPARAAMKHPGEHPRPNSCASRKSSLPESLQIYPACADAGQCVTAIVAALRR